MTAWLAGAPGSRLALAAALALGVGLAGAPSAAAEDAWVKGDVRVNLRTGASNQHRILGTLGTGDRVAILSRGEDWTEVRTAEGASGWIPAGFLDPEPPAGVRVDALEREVAELREELEATRRDSTALRSTNEQLSAAEAGQKEEIRKLTEENLDLKAGERWPYLITGASILGAGMLLGAILQRSSGRRNQPRIRF